MHVVPHCQKEGEESGILGHELEEHQGLMHPDFVEM